MSPTSDRSTGDSDPPRRSTRRMGASQPERDHAAPKSPSFEPLTPCIDDCCLPHNTDGSGRTESAVQSLLSLLRIPLILDSILRINNEGEQLSQGLRLALSVRSVPEQHRLRIFARSLSRNCDNLCEAGPSQANQEVDVGCRPNHERLDDGDARFQDDVALGCVIEAGSAAEPPAAPIKPAHIAENEEGDIALKERDEVPGSDPQQFADHDGVKQFTFQSADGRDPQPIHVEDVDERNEPTSDAFCTATFRPKTGIGEGKGASASVAGTTLVASSPNVVPSIEPMTPERTPSPSSLRGATLPRQTDDCEQGRLDLLDQAIDDFINDSHEQIRQFSTRGNSQETYKALFDSLGHGATEAGEDRTRWSDGSEWVSLLEAGHGERHKGTIRYALTAIAFARWHASQVQLVDGPTTAQKATQEVSARILGPKPEDDENKKGWERRRKKLSTHLARGRKWSRLVEELGSGILLKNAWRLAKSPESALNTLVRELPGSPEKMTVLRLLADQMTLLMETGRTNPDKFRYDLESEGLPFLDPGSSTGCVELDGLYEQVRNSITGDMLLVKGTDFKFGVDSLRRLGGTRWLNDEVILACLHLSDKLAFVRVGFSIPIHRQTRSLSTIPRPLERAAKQMAEWHCQAEARAALYASFRSSSTRATSASSRSTRGKGLFSITTRWAKEKTQTSRRRVKKSSLIFGMSKRERCGRMMGTAVVRW
ncbi:hypothetical protein EDB81DRAFT_888461 [Dactylonectria macrodidyma]|uniref:Uncharacterized protein n=1 Tax=Dactylonectria macrodidyma TaxID=307937 RepID=A0A9P9E5T5_9HYPO|nr:hypothetical protein EDB81DRAFT_888461 [Dactylonectria macrodidyma]